MNKKKRFYYSLDIDKLIDNIDEDSVALNVQSNIDRSFSITVYVSDSKNIQKVSIDEF
jgi:hypothetical protein